MMKTLINIIALLFLTFLSLFAQQKRSPIQEGVTYITGKLDKNIKSDTLYLVLHGQFYANMPEKGADTILTTTLDEKGNFCFKVLAKKSPFHVSLFTSSKRDSSFNLLADISDIKNYLIEPGDSIHVNFENGKLKFSGKNSALFAAQYAVQQTDPDGSRLSKGPYGIAFKDEPYQLMKYWDDVLNLQLNLLDSQKSKLSPLAFSIVKADILGSNRYVIYNVANFSDSFFGRPEPEHAKLNNFLKLLENQPPYLQFNNPAALSPLYIEYLYKKLTIEAKYSRALLKEPPRNYDYFQDIVKKYPVGPLRDKIMVRWISSMAGFNLMKPEFIDSAMKVVKTPIYLKMLNEIMQTFSKGSEVTDFEFKDVKGKTIRLADFKGKVLMIDMWFTGCGSCIAVAKGLPQVEEVFKNRDDIKFISISVDRDKKKWLSSIDKDTTGKTYTHFTTMSTVYLYTGGTGSQNQFIKKYALQGFPTLLIIDKTGHIFSSKVSRPVNNQGKGDLIAQLNAALKVP